MKRIFLIGYMGSGKTTAGKVLAAELGFSFVDMDAFIEEKYHQTVSQIFASLGQDKFREIEQNCLHQLAEIEHIVIATGGGAPCFYDNMEYMNSHGLTIYLSLTPEQLVTRLELSQAGKRPLLADRKGEELLRFISDGLAQRQPFYQKATLVVDGDGVDVVQRILKRINL